MTYATLTRIVPSTHAMRNLGKIHLIFVRLKMKRLQITVPFLMFQSVGIKVLSTMLVCSCLECPISKKLSKIQVVLLG